MRARHIRKVIPVMIGFVLCSCAWTTGNPNIMNMSVIQAFHQGNASMATVEQSLGPPDKKTNSATNIETWEYSRSSYYMIAPYWDIKTDILRIQFSNGQVMDVKRGYLGHEGISVWPSAGEWQ
jgi:hypothetical protein